MGGGGGSGCRSCSSRSGGGGGCYEKEPTQRTLYVDPVGVKRCCAVGAQAQRHLTRPRVDWTVILSLLYFNKHSITFQRNVRLFRDQNH
jgi:hypothetical protein